MKISKWLLFLGVFLMTAGVFATNSNKKIATEFWDYNGPAGQENVASNYSLGTSSPTHVCGLDVTTVCQIIAEKDPTNPSQPKLSGKNPMVDVSEFQTTKRSED